MNCDLLPGEPHPSARDALAWIKTIPIRHLLLWQDAFASSAISGSRLGEVCSETLDRLLHGKPVSDRYLLGLVWAIRKDEQ